MILIFLLSPLAGYLADVKFGRFKVLQYSTYLIIASMILLLASDVLLYIGHPHHNYLFVSLDITIVLAMLLYSCGNVFFLANFIQFGTDQHRDAPTRCSVLFLHVYLWCDAFGNALSLGVYLPGQKMNFILSKDLQLDPEGSVFAITAISIAIILSIVISFILHKRQGWFLIENIRGNPYKLVTNITLFAIRHKMPIRRSAFTFCENEAPSRIDFGKRRYGGPYTTEQVEDVKVLINIVKVLVALGPVFLLDVAATLSSISHPQQYNVSSINYHLEVWLLDYRILSTLFTVICIPVYLFLLKPLLVRFIPNFFKRIGISFAVLNILFLLNLLYDTIAYDTIKKLESNFEFCSRNTSYLLNWSLVSISPTYMLMLQPILLSITHMLLYISTWEFICCQSPQQMKGILFGLLFAIRALFRFLAMLSLVPFLFTWKSQVASCHTGYYLLNLCIGLVSLIMYTVVARRYKYRKRDDICNVYKFAEDYYSKHEDTEVTHLIKTVNIN